MSLVVSAAQILAGIGGREPDAAAGLTPAGQQELLFTGDVVALLGVSPYVVRALADSGRLPCVRTDVYGFRRFRPDDVLALKETLRNTATPVAIKGAGDREESAGLGRPPD